MKSYRRASITQLEAIRSQNTFQDKLITLYQSQNTLPKLIEDEAVKEQSLEDYYIKLQIILKDSDQEETSFSQRVTSYNQYESVSGAKRPIEIEQLFEQLDDKHPSANKILILGSAGIGKTTLMHYMAYRWATTLKSVPGITPESTLEVTQTPTTTTLKPQLWANKFDYVFRVKLKDLLSDDWKSNYDLKTELRVNLIACFIHSCLPSKVKKVITVEEVIAAMENKEKILLAIDGYDEIAYKVNSSDSNTSKEVFNEIFDTYPNIIMTSRPNALDNNKKAKLGFDREIENIGLDLQGIYQYVDRNFQGDTKLLEQKNKESKEELKSFLISNSNIRLFCTVPINVAMLCLIWQDHDVREKFQGDFNISILYHEVIIWLGKRYLKKFGSDEDKSRGLANINDNEIWSQRQITFLQDLAYESFVNQENLIIEGSLMNDLIAKHLKLQSSPTLKIEDIYRYGLLRAEKEDTENLKDNNFTFIHLTFQEYLTARCLLEKLASTNLSQAKETAEFIASHRNDLTYLMTLKFLAAMVTTRKKPSIADKETVSDQELISRFWESTTCNIDSIIELGLEQKVTLMMHLLGQAIIQGKVDSRIPNQEAITKLIDQAVIEDEEGIASWNEEIIYSGYISQKMLEKMCREIEGTSKTVKESPKTSKAENIAIILDILSNNVTKIKIINPNIEEELLKKSLMLLDHEEWIIRKKAAEVISDLLTNVTFKESSERQKTIKDAILNSLRKEITVNRVQDVVKAIGKTLGLNATKLNFTKEDLVSLKDIVESASAIYTISEIIEYSQDQIIITEALNLLTPFYKTKNVDVQISIAKALPKIIKYSKNQEIFKKAYEVLNFLKNSGDIFVRSSIFDDEMSILSLLPHKNPIVNAVEVIKLEKDPIIKLELLKSLFNNANDVITDDYAIQVMPTIVYSIKDSEISEQVFELLKSLFKNTNDMIKGCTVLIIPKILDSSKNPEMTKKVFELLISLLMDGNRWYSKILALDVLAEVIRYNEDKEITKKILELLEPLFKNSGSEVAFHAIRTMSKIVEFSEDPEIIKEAFRILNSLKNLNHAFALFDAIVAKISTLPLGSDNDPMYVFIIIESEKDPTKKLKLLNQNINGSTENYAFLAMSKIVDSSKDPKITKEAFELLKPLLKGENKAYLKIITANDLLPKIVEFSKDPEIAREAFELLKPLFGNSDNDVIYYAINPMSKIVEFSKNLKIAREAFELLKPLFGNSDNGIRRSAINSMTKIVEFSKDAKIIEEAFELLKLLFGNSDKDVRSSAINSMSKIVEFSKNPEIARKAFELLQSCLITDGESIAKYLKPLLNLIHASYPSYIGQTIEFLKHKSNEVRSLVISSFLTFISKLDQYTDLGKDQTIYAIAQILSCHRMVKLEAGKHDSSYSCSDAKKLLKLSSNALIKQVTKGVKAENQQLQNAKTLDDDTLEFINKRFNNLFSLGIEVRSFLKKLYHLVLEEQSKTSMTKTKKDFILKCLSHQFTSSFDSNNNEIILDGRPYKLKVDHDQKIEQEFELLAKAALNGKRNDDKPDDQIIDSDKLEVVTNDSNQDTTIKSSEEEQLIQYRDHTPLFPNSGSGIKISAADISKVTSLIDQDIPLTHDSYQLSLVTLANRSDNSPKMVKQFLLLEQRNVFGYYIAYQLTTKEETKVYKRHPQNLTTDFREEIFGKMIYKEVEIPAYYFTSLELDCQQGLSLLSLNFCEAKENIFNLLKASSILAEEQCQYLGLNLSWEEYLEYEETEMLSKLEILSLKGNQEEQYYRDEKLFMIQKDIDEIIAFITRLRNDIEKRIELKPGDQEIFSKDLYKASLYKILRDRIYYSFIAAECASTIFVATKKGVLGTTARSIKTAWSIVRSSAPVHIPLIGLAPVMTAEMLYYLDKKQQKQLIKHFKSIANNADEMDKLAMAIALKLAKELDSDITKKIIKELHNVLKQGLDQSRKGIEDAFDSAKSGSKKVLSAISKPFTKDTTQSTAGQIEASSEADDEAKIDEERKDGEELANLIVYNMSTGDLYKRIRDVTDKSDLTHKADLIVEFITKHKDKVTLTPKLLEAHLRATSSDHLPIIDTVTQKRDEGQLSQVLGRVKRFVSKATRNTHHSATAQDQILNDDSLTITETENLFERSGSQQLTDQDDAVVDSKTYSTDLDHFSYITNQSNLTYENIHYLLKIAFQKANIVKSESDYDQLVTSGLIDVAVISEDIQLDCSLRDDILKFIGQEESTRDRASIAICRGYIENREIRGSTHWTALHLRKVGSSIMFYHMDSMGTTIPSAIQRIITNIKTTTISQLDPLTAKGLPYQRAIERLPSITFDQCLNLPCLSQQDGYSCGYHTVFNMIKMHSAEDINFIPSTIFQGDNLVRLDIFITDSKEDLKQKFNDAIDQRRELRKDQLKTDFASNLNKEMLSNFYFALVVIESIVISEENHITKLEKLIKIEAFFKDGGQNSIILLSRLQIEKLYQKIIVDFIENVRFEMNISNLLNQENEEKLEILTSPKNLQNPELILDSLKKLSEDLISFFSQDQVDADPSLSSSKQKVHQYLLDYDFKNFKNAAEELSKNDEEVLKELEEAKSEIKSQTVLGYIYLRGLVPGKTIDDGLQLLLQASEDRFIPANLILADFYLKTNKELRNEYLQKAKTLGYQQSSPSNSPSPQPLENTEARGK
jgi:hypothetical protein